MLKCEKSGYIAKDSDNKDINTQSKTRPQLIKEIKSLCVTFLIAEAEYLTRSSLKEGGSVSAPQFKERCSPSWRLEYKEAGHMAAEVCNRRAVDRK